ncbi:MAG: YgiQ family radical SAM protein [Synergistaceae bacterium]|nr:YgiQ family radical SAM protein [Synergistaceae bacterium]
MVNENKKTVRRDAFLPVNKNDMEQRGWDALDFLMVSGDAYVDHPSFGHAIIARRLESRGYRVGIVAQPDWRSTDDFARMGKPRLGVMVTAGNLDSMLNHYTASGKKRRSDDYSPGGKCGMRPDRATIVYCNRIRELWKDVPLIIGGIEASLRRIAHYDYWNDDVRRSLLVDSRADLLVFGMAELSVTEIADALADGIPVGDIRTVSGTCWKTHDPETANDAVVLPSYDDVKSDKRKFASAFKRYYIEQDSFRGNRLIQDQGPWHVVQNIPSRPLSTGEMDSVYALPYVRAWHPDYDEAGGVPALEEVRFSITSHRGCFGECAFCAITSHQGRIIQRRSDGSMIAEAKRFKRMDGFKGYIHDVGGPTANFTIPACEEQMKRGSCTGKSCLYPEPCRKMKPDHTDYIELLRKLRSIPGIKKVFIRSGLRYDYILADKKTGFLEELCRFHVSGQLKIAPEHVSPAVLKRMRKPPGSVTSEFLSEYREMNIKLGMKQFLVPYFMSAHPGSTINEAIELAEFIRDSGLRPEQVQDFTPTPGTLSTCMYYTGIDPLTGEDVYVPKSFEERKQQRALLQYWMPENSDTVRKALEKAGRRDLIGKTHHCLVIEGRRHTDNFKSSMDNRRKTL